MEDNTNSIIDDEMKKVFDYTDREINKFRIGRADPSILENVKVLYYNNLTPISQISVINIVDVRTLCIKPYEKKLVKDICLAIIDKNLGINPQDDGDVIKIHFPSVTKERRIEIVKMIKIEGEKAKVSIRNIRRNFKDKTKNLKEEGFSDDKIKIFENKIQLKTDEYIRKIDVLIENKERDLMKM